MRYVRVALEALTVLGFAYLIIVPVLLTLAGATFSPAAVVAPFFGVALPCVAVETLSKK